MSDPISPVVHWIYRRRQVLLVSGMVVAAIAYIAITSWYQSSRSILPPRSYLVPRTFDVFIFGWSLWVGGSIGSFLNVVANRLPGGQSIRGRSHCPRCQHPLSLRDNLPLLGWLFLGGRCRTCRLPISVRYPLTEWVVGISIGMVAYARIHGWSLPHHENHITAFSLATPRFDDPGKGLLLVYHVLAVAAVWMLALIRMDGNRLPIRLTSITLLVITAMILAFPMLAVVPWNQWESADPYPISGSRIDAMLRVLTAWIAAALVGRTLARSVCPTADLKLDPLGKTTRRLVDLVAILAIPMLILGWQAGLAVVVIATLIAAGLQRGQRSGPDESSPDESRFADPLAAFAVATAAAFPIQLVLWKASHGWSFWPSDVAAPWPILVWGGVLLMSTLWLRPHAN
ncbi:MAG: prepilin peptidase, partial [Planctomycetota bacterium]